jgi:PKD repeat protein
MKKFYAFLVVILAFVSLQTNAQQSCDATFTTQFLNGSTVKFNPSALTLDSPNVQHYWYFGDGGGYNSYSYAVSPTHIFPTGTFQVNHYVSRSDSNGFTLCSNYSSQQITITQGACLLSADFYSYVNSGNNTSSLEYYYSNYSSYASPTDSIRWTFGDGTSSNAYSNVSHTFQSPGIYNVCLRIIKRNANGTLSNCISEKCKLDTVTYQCFTQAYFSSNADSIPTTAPATVNFTNQSYPFNSSDSLTWNFGDGSAVSHAANPNHVYANAGTYTVCLKVKRNNNAAGIPFCIKEYCKQITILTAVPNCNLLANFTYYRDSLITIPNSYHFTNTTTPLATTDSIRWTFGDGSSSNQVNPNHAYTSTGTFNVCLRVIKRNANGTLTNCVSEKCHPIIIGNTCNLVANFTWYRDSLPTVALHTYHFTNTSTPLASTDSIRWTFGDGTSSNQVNPNHVYTSTGTFNVCLRVIKRNANGTLTNCVKEKCYTLVITQQCNIIGSYTWRADSINYKTIIFTNTSNIPNAIATWSFGDGSSTTSWNATHTYAQPGRYNVCLRLQYGSCITYKCDTINIVAPISCNQLSNYQYSNGNGQVSFAPTFYESNVQYTWAFGDGTGAQGSSASHYYSIPGYYTACLTAFKNNNCASTTCKSIYIGTNCSTITLGINDVRDSLVPNRITFTALSNTAITNQQWTITKMPTTATNGTTTINTNNPTYMFLDSGYYNVCIKATYANGCIKTFCKTIHVAQNMPTANTCNLNIYPNPATIFANVIVTLTQPSILTATVFNSQNVQVAQQQQQGYVGNNAISVNIANIPAGAYIFRLVYGSQICYATFIKQ